MGDDGVGPWFCDHNAGAPATEEVLAEFAEVERRATANPASAHTPGRRARGELERARSRFAAALGVQPDDVVFTSGGTEAANLAVRGLGDADLPALLADVEHPAVRAPAEARGVVRWSTDEHGRAVVAAPSQPVGLVCLVHGQSEVGALQPVDDAARLAAELRVPLLVDASQTLGRVALDDVLASGALVVLSPHKAGGLRGHGALVGRGLHGALRPLLRGGGQELGLRPGTQSPALAAANALAVERAVVERERRARAMHATRAAFLAGVGDVAHRVLTPLRDSLPNTVMLCFGDIDGRSLLPALDLAGIHASHGSACSSGSPTPPPVLASMLRDEHDARSCVRFSFGWCADDVDAWTACGARVASIVARLRKKI